MDPDRRELERLAFSKPSTTQDAAAADGALRRLLAADAAAAPEKTPAAVDAETPTDGQEPTEPSPDYTDDVPVARARRRTLIPLIVVIGLVAGLGTGILVSRNAPALLSPPAVQPSAASPRPTPILGATTNALAELATPRTPRDVYPYPLSSITPDIEADSVHRILTTSDDATLWIARSPQYICMMFTVTGSNVQSGATCASIFEFSDTGLELGFNGERWDWDGSTFSTRITR